MVFHSKLGNGPEEIKQAVRKMIKNGEVKLGGNKRLGIYGTLDCKSGKKMNVENRVFFASEEEAKSKGYRPCGYCMRKKYERWKEAESKNGKDK